MRGHVSVHDPSCEAYARIRAQMYILFGHEAPQTLSVFMAYHVRLMPELGQTFISYSVDRPYEH